MKEILDQIFKAREEVLKESLQEYQPNLRKPIESLYKVKVSYILFNEMKKNLDHFIIAVDFRKDAWTVFGLRIEPDYNIDSWKLEKIG